MTAHFQNVQQSCSLRFRRLVLDDTTFLYSNSRILILYISTITRNWIFGLLAYVYVNIIDYGVLHRRQQQASTISMQSVSRSVRVPRRRLPVLTQLHSTPF